jgi:hypothetical protein
MNRYVWIAQDILQANLSYTNVLNFPIKSSNELLYLYWTEVHESLLLYHLNGLETSVF